LVFDLDLDLDLVLLERLFFFNFLPLEVDFFLTSFLPLELDRELLSDFVLLTFLVLFERDLVTFFLADLDLEVGFWRILAPLGVVL
jgi:hypothetical protein